MERTEMNQDQKDIVLEALTLKEASIKRAQKGSNARFQEIYQIDLDNLTAARSELIKLAVTK